MKHSIILKVGDNLIYQYAQEPKPVSEHTSSPVEFNRALPEWELTAKNYLIKKEDIEKMGDMVTPEKLIGGLPILYEKMEIYKDGLKEYARYSENPDRSLAPAVVTPKINPQHSVIHQPEKQEVQKEPKGMVVTFEIDENGEPMLIVPNNNYILPIEKKLFTAFQMKAERNGITLSKADDGGCTIRITTKS